MTKQDIPTCTIEVTIRKRCDEHDPATFTEPRTITINYKWVWFGKLHCLVNITQSEIEWGTIEKMNGKTYKWTAWAYYGVPYGANYLHGVCESENMAMDTIWQINKCRLYDKYYCA